MSFGRRHTTGSSGRNTLENRSGVRLRDIASDTRGAGMVEYIIILGVVALAGQTAFRAFGTALSKKVRQQADTVSQIDSDCVGGLCVLHATGGDPSGPTPAHS
jgi:pilus assembly protein Flp/PilA